jgi:4-hydroxy-2-oxoglutarate aldolase
LTKLDYKNFAATGRSSKELRGVLLPVTTPFNTDGGLDLDGLRSNLRSWNQSGLAGYVVLGSTGERVHLNEREYLQVVETARAEVPSGPEGLAFVVGAGQQSTRGTIDEIKKAATAGVDAVLVITPHFYRSAITPEALVDYYLAVADSSPVSIILYSMPALTSIRIEPETVARLSQHPNIIGVKDSSADVEALKRTVDLVRVQSANPSAHGSSPGRDGAAAGSSMRDDFVVLTGNGTVYYDALCAGADGAILAVGCVVPELCIEIFRAVKAGDNERAVALQKKLTPLAQAVTTKYGIGGLKAALDIVGYIGGAVRAPLRSADEEARQEISRILEEARSLTTESLMEATEA